MPYEPLGLPVTQDVPILTEAVQRELDEIAAQFTKVDSLLLAELHADLDRPQNGMIILADGTDFNPGSGAGFYGRSAGAWVFLG